MKVRHRIHPVKVPTEIDVRAIRTGLNLTRIEFAAYFGFSVRTLEKWEQKIRQPEGAARAYLTVISRIPEAVKTALQQEIKAPE